MVKRKAAFTMSELMITVLLLIIAGAMAWSIYMFGWRAWRQSTTELELLQVAKKTVESMVYGGGTMKGIIEAKSITISFSGNPTNTKVANRIDFTLPDSITRSYFSQRRYGWETTYDIIYDPKTYNSYYDELFVLDSRRRDIKATSFEVRGNTATNPTEIGIRLRLERKVRGLRAVTATFDTSVQTNVYRRN